MRGAIVWRDDLGSRVEQYRLLGPLEVWAGQRRVQVRRGRQETVLAALLVAPRKVVSLQRLVECVWADVPPATAEKVIRNTVSELRQVLTGGTAIVAVADGYRLDVPDDAIDSAMFEERLTQAREHARSDRPTDAISAYGEALALWRGAALQGLHNSILQPEAVRLNELRLVALEECVELELDQGQHDRLADELASWMVHHPVRERLAAQFVLALYRSGRQAEALDAYGRTRRALADHLGVAPGPALRELHRRILANDPTLSWAPPKTTRPRTRCDLPADPRHIVGRSTELRVIRELLADAQSTMTALAVAAIDGMAGVGKTTFAVHAAHQLGHHFPDGQLFVDLQAFTPGQQPLDAASALDRLLRALGVPGDQIPSSLAERAAEWRAQVAHRRVVVVLDNAADAGQVRPLVPGTPSSLVLITSRRRLVGLDNATSLTLDPLHPEDARSLFSAVAGEDRVAADPEALQDMLALCGFLPLAIRIAAVRLRHRPAWTVRYLVNRVQNERRLLAELEADDRSVAGTFGLSYLVLNTSQQRLFRLLGLLPGQDIDIYGAAALTDTTAETAEGLLEDLVDTHLVEQPTPGRYRLHDLVRAYASTQVDDGDREAAPDRLLGYYLRTTLVAMDILAPLEKHRRPRVTSSRMSGPDLSTYDSGVNWLDIEYANLLAAVRHAAAHRRHEHVIMMSAALWRYFHIRDSHDDAHAVHTQALAAARATSDTAAEAHIYTYLGDNNWWLGRYGAALHDHERALRLARDIHEIHAEGRALHGLGITYMRLGEYEAATEHLREGLRLSRAAQDHSMTAFMLRGLGELFLRLNDVRQALGYLRQALELARTTHNDNMIGRALRGLGEVHVRLGEPEQAVSHFREALLHGRVTHNRNVEARALHGLGQAHLQLGRVDDALDNLEKAVAIAGGTHNHALETEALITLGDARRRQHDQHGALECYHQALVLATRANDRYEQARAHQQIAGVYGDLDDKPKALSHWQKAALLYSGLGGIGAK